MKRLFCIVFLALLLCSCSNAKEKITTEEYIATDTEATIQTTTEVTAPKASHAVIASKTTASSTTTAASETTAAAASAETVTLKSEITEPKPQFTNKIYLNGPNMVYTGDSFQFTFKISHRNAERATILWKCEGDAGSITENGLFTAKKKGTVTLTVTDISNGLSDSLTVHVVDTEEDVDFVPMVNGIPIANKTYPVPKNYNPGLDNETYSAFLKLRSAAAAEGLDIFFMSGFRSYEDQQIVYNGWVEEYGSGAERLSARPGHSEHQLGLAIDVNSIQFSFADTPEGIWLAENCWKYGFIIRYKKETEEITGYMYEPWHIRYLGELAEEVHFSGLTLEEYLGIDSTYREPFTDPNVDSEE